MTTAPVAGAWSEAGDVRLMMVQHLLDSDAELAIPSIVAPVSSFADVVAPSRRNETPEPRRVVT